MYSLLRVNRNVRKFIADSLAHTVFYGILGTVIALAFGIELKVYVAMSIIGTVVQFLSGGVFGRFLDLVRRMVGV